MAEVHGACPTIAGTDKIVAWSRNVCMRPSYIWGVTGECEAWNPIRQIRHEFLNSKTWLGRKANLFMEQFPIHIERAHLDHLRL
jgi:hypothetical protein